MSLLTPQQKTWRKLMRIIEERKSTNLDGTPELANQLYNYLKRNDWEDIPEDDLHSYCTKAQVEYNLSHYTGYNLNIVAATFIGEFIDLTFTKW